MPRSRASRARDENLDPLLDTMANVVGILVVLVAVTQLSVGDAVERIRETRAHQNVSQESLERAEQQREQLEQAVAAAREGERPAGRDAEQPALLLADARPLIEELEALPDREELRGMGRAKLRTRVEAETALLEQLEQRVARDRSRALRLDGVLRELPTEVRPKRARLPDPRPPPPGSREIAFFCRYGRIVALDLEALTEQLDAGMKLALGRERSGEWEDIPWLINLFSKQGIGQKGFRWSFREPEGGRLFADIRWRDEENGETLAALAAADSEYQQRLRKQTPDGYYLRYYVWSDSFEVYLEARYIAESVGYVVSWYAVDAKDEVGIEMSGRGRRPRILID